MDQHLSLNNVKEILKNCPLEKNQLGFDEALRAFLDELLLIKKRNINVPKNLKNTEEYQNIIDDNDSLLNIDYWKELSNFYFYNLIRKYSRNNINPSDAEHILEECIINRYISYKNISMKLAAIKNDEHLTRKFTSDLFYEVQNYFLKNNNNRIIQQGKEYQEGNEIELYSDSTNEEVRVIEAIDYQKSDITNYLINKLNINHETISKLIIWKFRRLDRIKLEFKNETVQLPIKFNLQNIHVVRYYYRNKSNILKLKNEEVL